MPARHAIWKVGQPPHPLEKSVLISEDLLEDMIASNPSLLSDEWMLIGRQVETGFGGRIDLLAVAPDCSLVLIELKRDQTPREVVAQAIDYASWVAELEPEGIAAIYEDFAPNQSLQLDFRDRFGQVLDEDSLNKDHQIIIVAAALDDSTERMVAYLKERNIPINVLFFQVFAHGPEQLLSRTWLVDPVRAQVSAATAVDRAIQPWNGEFYCSFGHGEARSWDDARQYGFISAGGGAWYSRTFDLLSPENRIWVKVPEYGFVGVGRVKGQREPASTFKVSTPEGQRRILDITTRGHYLRASVDDLEKCEYFVPVEWLETVPLNEAVYEIGLFGNQNTVCKPIAAKWRSTVELLKQRFPRFGG